MPVIFVWGFITAELVLAISVVTEKENNIQFNVFKVAMGF